MNDPSVLSQILGIAAVLGATFAIVWLLYGEVWDD